MKLNGKIVILFSLLFAKLSFAQDIHFSQFDGSLLNISPAFTGFFNGDYRIGGIYRSQWQSVPVKYSTFSMNGEARLQPKKMERDMIGVGLLFNSDKAGDAAYGTTQLYLSGSYIFLCKPDSSLLISFGANMGWVQVGFDFGKMTFDNQYDGYQYNRTLASGEQFNYTRDNLFDANVGAAAQYIVNPKHRFVYGVSFQHITNPTISYYGNDLSRLTYKFSNYLCYGRVMNDKTDLITEGLVNFQGKYYELIPQLSLKYFFSRAENKAVSFGASYRTRDAVIARLGYTDKTLQGGIAYDINVSNFNAATNRRGGFELFLNYVIKLKPSFIARKRYCPIFM
ncbi:MAG: PorP/SprF family type IX secretion system membrane protein [Bacteroidetes bacterium]|nr:PorP/SprF family type IX secretion system membrane protein [Bacteroidota bacterium]